MGTKAVVLLSGGLDSTTMVAVAKSQGYDICALSFLYGQRHKVEIEAAEKVATHFGVAKHAVTQIDLRAFGGSALTDNLTVPKHRSFAEMTQGIPVTYVPARNTIFLSFALAWAEVLNSTDIFIGVNASDTAGYPDCRPEYIEAYQRMANLGTKVGAEGHGRLTIHAPFIDLSKAQIIKRGLELGVDYSITFSCYDPSPEGLACGQCDSCMLRLKGFEENERSDPAEYQSRSQP